ncbi:MAG TPA: prolyl oligopeptidase family serine peptidase [Azospirillaceae bacterium]|nr:prolyl oligopeptidase family serine peptidase [Azospirillaceae bacterium]
MHQPIAAPYGTWRSPVTADLIVGETIRIGHVAVDGADTWWVEVRPAEAGRAVVMRRAGDGTLQEMTPPGFNARSRVHEYGGGDFTAAGGMVWFANAADQRIYRSDGQTAPVPVTPAGPWRYADLALDTARNRLIAVREDHSGGGRQPVDTLVAIPLDGGESAGEVLAGGADFYAAPSLSPDGGQLAWLEWNHPHMPWDGTELKLARFDADGRAENPLRVAGGPRISVVQPRWSPRGELFFVDDRAGWWNLRRWQGCSSETVLQMQAEFAKPLWVLGQSTYGFTPDGRLVAAYAMDGVWSLTEVNVDAQQMTPIELPYTDLGMVLVAGRRAVLTAGSPTEALALVDLDLASGVSRLLRRTTTPVINEDYISVAQALRFQGFGGHTAHAFYYPPVNRDFVGPKGALPPLIVKTHGGPTGATSGTLSLSIQYWTSRGFAVLDVNYTGSTGYGTAYRRRLCGQWGIADVDDAAAGATYLVDAGLVDGDRLIITGSSAGGYTTLAALTFRDTFKAGASYYGISDLCALAEDTHKFEAHYTDSLVAPWPEGRAEYEARSPIRYPERLGCPVIFFQGLQDKVVPPEQAERMVEALRAKGLPVEYVTFADEMHGFRNGANIKRALEAELAFYCRVFGIG